MMYIRCNLVGHDCKFMVKAETEQAIIDQYGKHLQQAHGIDPKNQINTVKACIRTAGQAAASAH